jgi:hypothetical protein
LAGWIIQNCEPFDEHARVDLGVRGRALYQEALDKESESEATESVWLRKGLANALIRIPDMHDEAIAHYTAVIEACERRISAGGSPRIFTLLGLCYHSIGEHESARSTTSLYIEGARSPLRVFSILRLSPKWHG